MMNFRTTASAVAALVIASPALADLTAEEVLSDQLEMLTLYGFEASVENETKSGGEIATGDLTATASFEGQDITLVMGGITFIEQDDGSVRLDYGSTMPLTVTGTTPEGEYDFSMVLGFENTTAVASGDAENIRYDYEGDAITLGQFEMNVDGEEMPETIDMSFTARNLTGFGEFSPTDRPDVRDYVADIDIGSMTASVGAQDTRDGGSFDSTFDVSDVALDYTGSIAPQDFNASLGDSVMAGNSAEGSVTHGPLTYQITLASPDGNGDVAFSAASGTFDFSMTEDGLDYGGTNTDTTLAMQLPGIPLPILASVAETGGRFNFPLVPSDEVQDFGVQAFFRGLSVDDSLWGLIDPAGQLPRDPATFVLDVEGSGVLAEDIFAPDYNPSASATPGNLESISINQLQLSLLGADVSGDGSFTFDNEGPVPQPIGQVDLTLTGINSLMDLLVNMGLLPQEQAMGARMMMGLFARPGDGPDTLVSTIELREGGSVFANGQQIR